MRLLNFLFVIAFCLLSWASAAWAQGCRDPELRKKVTQTAQAEGVDEKELLSIIAHESSCRHYVIAWNIPKQPKSAQSKFFASMEEAKAFAEELIATGSYRVDVGIGQINYEAHIRPKGWALEEVLGPKTALNRVAKILKERGWERYHSNNPVYAQKWRMMALAALNSALSNLDTSFKRSSLKPLKAFLQKGQAPVVIFNSLQASALNEKPPPAEKIFKVKLVPPQSSSLIVFNERTTTEQNKKSSWIVYGTY